MVTSPERRRVVDRRRGAERRSTLDRRGRHARPPSTETPGEHIRNALQLLYDLAANDERSDGTGSVLAAAIQRVRRALSLLERPRQ